jgi:hypothetical protein
MGIWEDLLLCYKGTCTECFINRYFYSCNVMLPLLSEKKDSYNFITDKGEMFCPPFHFPAQWLCFTFSLKPTASNLCSFSTFFLQEITYSLFNITFLFCTSLLFKCSLQKFLRSGLVIDLDLI